MRPDIVKKQPMSGSLKMARHRAPHDPKANEANIDHFVFSFASSIRRRPMCGAYHPRPSTVVVFGLYSQPTQPRYPISSR